MTRTLSDFTEIVFLDFEFLAPPGESPQPVCLVAIEQRSGKVIRQWLDGVSIPSAPPFAFGPSVLTIAYFASAELGCYEVLNWPSHRVIDLYAEFRVATNGLRTGRSLLDAQHYFGISGAMDADQKEHYRKRILAGGPFTSAEQKALLDYCQSDVEAMRQLFPHLIKDDAALTGALVRGEFTKVIAHAETTGIPLDAPFYRGMVEHWESLQSAIIERVNATIPVFEGHSFRIARFEAWIKSRGFYEDWPRTGTGMIALDDDSFRDQAFLHRELEPLRQTRQMLGQMRKPGLRVGADGRNRCLLSPFSTKTSRCAPSTAHFIFGAPSFMRMLIRPQPGKALAYVDWDQQEFGIAAALSGDTAMQESYRSGDPYLAFAKFAGAVPANATDKTHPAERNLYKSTVLGIQYLISAPGLAYRLGVTLTEASDLLEHHRRIYSRFWEWSDAVCDYGQLRGEISATFGWPLRLTGDTSLRTVRNFPMQANGAEMLRLACIFALQAGVSILAPVHDALLIEAAADDINHVVAQTQTAMRRASEIVLSGFPLTTGGGEGVQVIHHPDRFWVKRGSTMWQWMIETLPTLGEPVR